MPSVLFEKLPQTQQQSRNPHLSDARQRQQQKRIRAQINLRNNIMGFDHELKQDYIEAIRKAPRVLMETESDPILFLRHACFDLQEASKRLCVYWKERKALFGPERAFLPLTLTGHHALDIDDVLSLQAACPALLLPPESKQKLCPKWKKPTPVLYLDPVQCLSSSTVQGVKRGIFYLINFLLSKDASGFAPAHDNGISMLIPLSLTSMNKTGEDDTILKQLGLISQVIDIMAHALPVKCTWHVLVQNGRSGNCNNQSESIFQQKEDFLVATCASHLNSANQNFHLHKIAVGDAVIASADGANNFCMGNKQWLLQDFFASAGIQNPPQSGAAKDEMRDVLQGCLGLSESGENVPKELGGSCDLSQVCGDWCRKRAMIEQQRLIQEERAEQQKHADHARFLQQDSAQFGSNTTLLASVPFQKDYLKMYSKTNVIKQTRKVAKTNPETLGKEISAPFVSVAANVSLCSSSLSTSSMSSVLSAEELPNLSTQNYNQTNDMRMASGLKRQLPEAGTNLEDLFHRLRGQEKQNDRFTPTAKKQKHSVPPQPTNQSMADVNKNLDLILSLISQRQRQVPSFPNVLTTDSCTPATQIRSDMARAIVPCQVQGKGRVKLPSTSSNDSPALVMLLNSLLSQNK